MFRSQRKPYSPSIRRRAGESLREKRENLIDDTLPPIVFLPFLFWFVYAVQQVQQSKHWVPHPYLWLSIAVISTGISAMWFRRLLPIARRLNRGERGELHVGDALEDLRADGYKPIHDIVAGKFNIDHVLVGPGGVFAIETKFRSGTGEITFRDGDGLFVGGFSEEKDCLKQARGNARAVSEMIANNCGRREWVTPLVVFVGDWRVKDEWRSTATRVFTPDRLARYIRNQQPQLKKSEIDLIASHLERSTRQ
ncbi:MAG: hypothetical protein QOI04_140 [Verrucomicrobiota bacterium]